LEAGRVVSRYDTMAPAQIARTMGRTQRELLAACEAEPTYAEKAHPSTREALITRGLIVQSGAVLVVTQRGADVLAEVTR
jgi:hypothetical protein